jgi:hypothetical protein
MSLILDGTDGLSDVDGTAATPAIRGADTNTGIFFPAADTIAFSEGGVESARFDSAGNLGIGTTSPSAILETSVNASSGSVNAVFRNSNNGANTTKTISASFRGADTVSGSKEASRILVGPADQDWNGAYLSFQTRGSDILTERMRIDSSGALLVGVTVSAGAGGVSIIPAGAAGTGNILFNRINTASTSFPLDFRNGGSTVGYISYTNTAVAYVTSSDYRLKENIAPMTGALATVSALKPVTYNWKVDGSASQGFIAHELAEVCPDAVTGEKDAVDADGKPVYQGIDTSFLVATLTAAIQELKSDLDSTKTLLANAISTVDAQAARIAALENPPVESATNE